MNNYLPTTCLLLLGLLHAEEASNNDFEHIENYFSFDEGRNRLSVNQWQHGSKTVSDACGSADLVLQWSHSERRSSEEPVDNAIWAPGHQHTCIRNWEPMEPYKALGMVNDFTLSFRIRCERGMAAEGVVIQKLGNEQTLLWGAMDQRGRIGLKQGKRMLLNSPQRVDDGKWHHVVFTHRAEDGALQLYLDGKVVASGQCSRQLNNADAISARGCELDDLHIFNTVVSHATVEILRTNRRPETCTLRSVVHPTLPTTINLHDLPGFCDPDGDRLRVRYIHASNNCRVEHKGDGVLEFTPGKKFEKSGVFTFSIAVTDGRGGFTPMRVRLTDARHAVPECVTTFAYSGDLPALPAGLNPEKGARPVLLHRTDGNPDLLVVADGRMWYYRNNSTPGNPQFAAPQEVATAARVDNVLTVGENQLLLYMNFRLLPFVWKTNEQPQLQTLPPAPKHQPRRYCLDQAAALDLDGSGIADILYLRGGYELEYQPDGATKQKSFHTSPLLKDSHAAIGSGDLNGDGLPEILYDSPSTPMIALVNTPGNFINSRGGEMLRLHFTDLKKGHFLTGWKALQPTAADVDGDGKADLIIGCTGETTLSILLGRK